MIKEVFFIEDWKVTIFIADSKQNVEEVITALYNLGCTYEGALEAYDNMVNIKRNIGFTYSNLNKKESMIFIGFQTSYSQLINTIIHESRHLQQHIALIKGYDQNGEEVCYLIGKIGQIIYEICRRYLKVEGL